MEERRRPLLISGALSISIAVTALLRLYRLCDLPPGLHYDEAFNDLLALRLLTSPRLPAFFAVEWGRSVAHPCLIALLFTLTGPTVLGGRIVSAICGILTVVVLFFALREVFWDVVGEPSASWLGVVSTIVLATLYWHVNLSRLGMEMVLVPLASTAALGASWRALHPARGRLWHGALAGLLLGLVAYTYPPAVFTYPVVLVLVCWRALSRRGALRARLPVLALMAGGVLLSLLPLILFFVHDPYWLTARGRQVVSGDVWHNLGLVARAVLGEGDLNPRQNLPGRPILDVVQGALFIIGLLVCLRRRSPADGFLVLWLAAMFLPGVLTEGAPNFRRMAGATAPIAALAGLGGLGVYRWVVRVLRRWRLKGLVSLVACILLRSLTVAMLIVALACSGWHTAHDYFLVWATSSDLFIAFDVGLRWVGETIAALPDEQPVYVSPTDRYWKTLQFLLDDDPFRTHNYNGRRCVVLPAQTGAPTTHAIVVLEDKNSLPALQSAYARGCVVDELAMGGGRYAVIYRTPEGQVARLTPEVSFDLVYGAQVRLLGADLPSSVVRPGDILSLTLYWSAPHLVEERYKVFVHLCSPSSASGEGRIWAQEDVFHCDNSYPTDWWAAGDVVIDEYRLALPEQTPPGEYVICAGLYREGDGRLPATTGDGRELGDRVIVAQVRVSP